MRVVAWRCVRKSSTGPPTLPASVLRSVRATEWAFAESDQTTFSGVRPLRGRMKPGTQRAYGDPGESHSDCALACAKAVTGGVEVWVLSTIYSKKHTLRNSYKPAPFFASLLLQLSQLLPHALYFPATVSDAW